MNLVDSCGWLEYFADGPNAGFFAPAVEDVENLLVPAICLFEVFKRILQQRGEGPALQAAAAMQQGRVANLDAATAVHAAKLAADIRLPLADSVVLATARLHDAVVWTQDTHFKDLPGVKYTASR